MAFNGVASHAPNSADISTMKYIVERHDSARASPEPLDAFHALVQDINAVLGPSSGIDSADVDVAELQKLMSAYESKEEDWVRYAFADPSRGYTRNLVDRGNGKANLLVLVWTPGKASPVHDHANAHCVMKILKGSLTETIYRWPCERSGSQMMCTSTGDSSRPLTKHTCSAGPHALGSSELCVQKETTYSRDQVTYMSDGLGLHRVGNPSKTDFAVSLHLYTPPNAAKHGCHVFDERTGKKMHVSQCHFYSELGVRT